MRNNLVVLMAQKAQRERRRISLRTVARETGINKYTVYALANDSLREYPKDVLVSLCSYLGCDLGELLLLVDIDDVGPAPGS